MIASILRQNESTVLVQNSNIQQQNDRHYLHRNINFQEYLPYSTTYYQGQTYAAPIINVITALKSHFSMGRMNGKYGSTGLKLLKIDKDGMMMLDNPLPKLQGSAGEFAFTDGP
ncbi:hypothetical protein DPMN_191544 [Dreissena polymorpha]|uniref:Uncharacterized protein n=1 Tax=Dreissena polymorpha TaxID=45954 RepID=A0A9D3Y5L6_DREPO|nr:hypothetical protein DPMN_191544 [Dreissena polymorpha]